VREPTVLDLTFIEDEQRRVQVADDMALVYDGCRSGGVHWRWDHICETVPDQQWNEEERRFEEHGEITKRVASYLSRGHRIVADDPLTIEGSLLCRSCGLHGFVREGRWVPA
jgi:hypothetical protein